MSFWKFWETRSHHVFLNYTRKIELAPPSRHIGSVNTPGEGTAELRERHLLMIDAFALLQKWDLLIDRLQGKISTYLIHFLIYKKKLRQDKRDSICVILHLWIDSAVKYTSVMARLCYVGFLIFIGTKYCQNTMCVPWSQA